MTPPVSVLATSTSFSTPAETLSTASLSSGSTALSSTPLATSR